jgi:hypothetical protein
MKDATEPGGGEPGSVHVRRGAVQIALVAVLSALS